MKFILLAAVAAIATPAFAQDTGTAPTDQTAPAGGADQSMGAPQGDAMTPPPSASDQSMQQQQQQQPMTPPSGGGMASAPSDPNAGDPAGGYAPSSAPTSAPAGARVVFQQAPSPTEAFPPPAPMAKYPICKKGQYDNCMQRGGR